MSTRVRTTPKWVLVLGAVVAIGVLAMVMLHIGGHAPMGHM